MSQSLAKALQVLVRLGDGPATLDQLAAVVGVHKTTVLRLLRTLAEEHFVYRDGTQRYHLGSGVFELSSRGLEQREVRATAAPHLAAFNREHGRTVHLVELDGAEIVYIDKLESHDQVRMASRIGRRAPVHSTAAGKVLAADLPAAALDDVLAAATFRRATPNTITDPGEFRAELARVRAQGWAHDREENEPSINCISAPVRDASGAAVAAVSVSVPDIVLTYDQLLELRPALLAVTERISRDSGWRPERNPVSKTVISTPAAPTPMPVFSQGVRKGPILQVSGQGPADPATGEFVALGDVKAQTLRTLENVRAILEAGGASVEDVVMFRVYLTVREDFAAMNEVFGEFVAKHVPSGQLPSRTTVFVGLPHESMLVEIDALAVVG